MTAGSGTAPAAEPRGEDDLAQMHDLHDLGAALDLPRPGLKRRLQRFLARVLRPVLDRQSRVNAAAARLASENRAQLTRLHDRIDDRHEETMAFIGQAQRALRDELISPILVLEQRVAALHAESLDVKLRYTPLITRELDAQARRQETALLALAVRVEAIVQSATAAAAPAPGPLAAPPPPPAAVSHELAALQARLADVFRGPPELVRERLRAYLPFVRDLRPVDAAAPIVDLGCGRGEWLELLRDEGLAAIGVESNPVLLEQLRAIGLDVAAADAIDWLAARRPESAAAVTAYHLIEHLPFADLVRLLDQAARVLRPGGLLVLETPNPGNLLVAAQSFHDDPTHVRPVPQALLRFLAGDRGFRDARTVERNPPAEVPERGGTPLPPRLHALLFAPQDYALIAWKA